MTRLMPEAEGFCGLPGPLPGGGRFCNLLESGGSDFKVNGASDPDATTSRMPTGTRTGRLLMGRLFRRVAAEVRAGRVAREEREWVAFCAW